MEHRSIASSSSEKLCSRRGNYRGCSAQRNHGEASDDCMPGRWQLNVTEPVARRVWL